MILVMEKETVLEKRLQSVANRFPVEALKYESKEPGIYSLKISGTILVPNN